MWSEVAIEFLLFSIIYHVTHPLSALQRPLQHISDVGAFHGSLPSFLLLHWLTPVPILLCSAFSKQGLRSISVCARTTHPLAMFFRICVAVLSPLLIHINFRINFSSSLIKAVGVVIVIASNLKAVWERIDTFPILSLCIHKYIITSLSLSLMPFNRVLSFTLERFCTSFVKLIPVS